MFISILLLVVDVLLWLLLIALRAVRLHRSSVSDYELDRRIKAGDEVAIETRRRDELLPELRELKYLVELLLFVLVIVLTVVLAGPWWAIPIMFVVLLQIEATVRSKWVIAQAERLYAQHELAILEIVERCRPVLQRLRGETPLNKGQFVYTKQELLDRLATTTVLDEHEMSLLKHGLAFGAKTVEDVMTPRTVIEAIRETDTLGPVLLDRLHKSGHSRFPVYGEDIDHMTGMLYTHDLVPLNPKFKTVQDATRHDIFYIRQDHSLEHALAAFLRTHHHLFIVVNQYRETVGLLSLEDVIEALLGRRIVDEFDQHHDLRAVAEKNPRHNNVPKQRKDV
ncbi:CBS domain-containing protein [Candidatus Saccharibacteria bacterium]|nr:CBS domain-containing protein [Candidatus Saccharibacteria bacterium]